MICLPKGLRKTRTISSQEEKRQVLAEVSETVQRSEDTRTLFSEKTNKTEKLLVTISFSKIKKKNYWSLRQKGAIHAHHIQRHTPKIAKMEFIILHTNLEK